jgi:hypothetical protein
MKKVLFLVCVFSFVISLESIKNTKIGEELNNIGETFNEAVSKPQQQSFTYESLTQQGYCKAGNACNSQCVKNAKKLVSFAEGAGYWLPKMHQRIEIILSIRFFIKH